MLSSTQTNAEKTLTLARKFETRKEWDRALVLLEKANKQHPDDIRITSALGVACFKSGRFKDAIGPLSIVVKHNPADQKASKRLATSVLRSAKNDTAALSRTGLPSIDDTHARHSEHSIGPRSEWSEMLSRLNQISSKASREDIFRLIYNISQDFCVSGQIDQSSVKLFEHRFPIIDYQSHPGYGLDSSLFETPLQNEAIDALYKQFVPLWNEYINLLKKSRPTTIEAEHENTHKYIQRDGIVVIRMSDEERRTMVEITEDAAVALKTKRARLDKAKRGVEAVSHSLFHIRDKTETPFSKFIHHVFDKYGIMRIASAYHGVAMQLRLANLQINSDQDTSIKNNCTVGDLDLSPGYYLHIDSKFGTMKVIIYRKDCTAENGAFRYVPGSNRIGVSPFELCIRKATDNSNLDSAKTKNRQFFAQLPQFLQHKANFGNDLLVDDPDLVKFLEKEKTMEGSAGDMVMFDNNGVHRGAIFESGEREIIQVVLEPH